MINNYLSTDENYVFNRKSSNPINQKYYYEFRGRDATSFFSWWLRSLGLAQRGRYDENGKVIQKYELNGTEKSNAMTTVSKDTLLFIPVDKHSSSSGLVCLGGVMKPIHKLWLDNGKLLQRNFSQGNRVYSSAGKSATLNAISGGIGGKTGLYEIEGVIRKLTRLECERLQTVKDNFTNHVSDSQRYKMLGNGWTVDVIANILKYYEVS